MTLEERRKVLEMLAAGKITREQAAQLLNRLSPNRERQYTAEAAVDNDGQGSRQGPPPLRDLRVVVDSPDRNSVNVRLPLKFLRTGLKLSALIPGQAGKHLSEHGIDLSYLGKLDRDALNAAFAELDVNIETEKGKSPCLL